VGYFSNKSIAGYFSKRSTSCRKTGPALRSPTTRRSTVTTSCPGPPVVPLFYAPFAVPVRQPRSFFLASALVGLVPLLHSWYGPDPCAGPLQVSPDRHCQRRLVHIPIGRFGEAKEIARAALFLASEESSFVTGTEFLVDGGITEAYVTPE
jgi:NAD(P)-dependent dehydrogenase (short-subunit alcohol dehydrogenase family)